jgi:hypothetical protein
MGGQTNMADADPSTLIGRGQLPPNLGFHITYPACDPGVGQQSRRINFQVLACHLEPATIRPNASTAPLPAGAQVGVELRAAVNAILPPPFHDQFGIDKRLKHAVRLRCDMNLADNFI